MHSNIELILTLTAGLAVALALGFAALRARLPPIVGYLTAGLLIGPYTPGYVANRGLADQLAEVGVILLMFGVGLHFHLKDLLAVGRIAVTGAIGQVAIATGLGCLAGRSFGWDWPAAVIFGIALSVASTVVLTRVLADHDDLQTQTGRIAFGWLVVEDLFTVFVLVVVPSVFGSSSSVPLAVGLAALKLVAFSTLVLVGGSRLIPYLLTLAARANSRELFTLTVLVIALGTAVGSATLFGVSMALGAFLAGMVVGQSEFSSRAASEALPMRDAFAVLFFVSVGMLFNPQHLLRAPAEILLTAAIVMLAKPLVALGIVLLFGYGPGIALRTGAVLGQIGEFSFLVATMGQQLKLLPAGAMDSLVAVSIVSITFNPLLYRLMPLLERLFLRRKPARSGAPAAPARAGRETRAVVVGYGPVGQSIANLLAKRGITPSIVELNIETVRSLHEQGIRATYGDAMHADTLTEAGTDGAAALILSAPGTEDSSEIIRIAREINPDIRVLARSTFRGVTEAMRKAGADEVYSGEAEVALAMIESILNRVGATPEQMDHERRSARQDLYGD